MISHEEALIYTMVLVSAADNEMSDAELRRIGDMVSTMPIFKGFDAERLTTVARDCAERLQADNALDATLGEIKEALPRKLHETAYAFACDVAAADDTLSQEEIRLLEMIRHRLGIDRLSAAAIERAARARHMTL
ncbi:MAG: tellurite resistance TerB family protein [Rhodospirillaceae bacterium]|nr:tellurite resistance TerB family protein [Rhodospirillaceae bacterium]MBT6118512.1 tellurite resistance TerB family protein [Rhodospirillaceae bacterium]